jgi:hypothetical protein
MRDSGSTDSKRTLTFNTNGGTAIAQQTHPAGSVITNPTTRLKQAIILKAGIQIRILPRYSHSVTCRMRNNRLLQSGQGKSITLSFDENGGDELPADKGSKKLSMARLMASFPYRAGRI